MSSESGPSMPVAAPRPGVVLALGIGNVVVSTLISICLFGSSLWYLAAARAGPARAPNVATKAVVPPPPPGSITITLDPTVGMGDPAMIRWALVDVGSALGLNGLMFATGIGLINRRRWAARWWARGAWLKIVRLALIWGWFIVAVAPTMADQMGLAGMEMARQQGTAGRISLAYMTRVYSIMLLATGVAMIGFGVIYPIASIWLLGRPGVRAALVDSEKPRTEPELP